MSVEQVLTRDLTIKVESLRQIRLLLKQMRKEQKLTTHVLGKMIGYSGSTIHYWERGDRNTRFVSFLDWIQGLGYDVHIVKRKD